MQLRDAIAASGMTPPENLMEGRWIRFPGVGKSRSNRAGWCRVISPTLAVFGDWSSDLNVTWRDDLHRSSRESERQLDEARARSRMFAREQRARQARAAEEARFLIREATAKPHPYLVRKGFPAELALVHTDGMLLVPMRDVCDYRSVIGVQQIWEDGTKKFLPGTRARGGIYRLGNPRSTRFLLCEGYATGLSLHAAARLLPGPYAVVVCFSAGNLRIVADHFPGAIVCADHDETGVGERAAVETGLPWVMPPTVGEDWNDAHLRAGLVSVVEALRSVAI